MGDVTQAENAMGAAVATRRLDELPGPRRLPLIGNIHQLHGRSAHRDVEQWAQRYGPFFHFRLGRRRFLGITDPDVILSVLRDRPDGFRRSVRMEQMTREMGLEPGLFVSNGEAWQRQRRMVMSAFDPAHVKAYFPTLLKVANRLARRWRGAAASRTPIDLRADLMRYTVDAVAGLAFGTDMNTLESDGEILQNHLDKVLPVLFRRLLAPFPYWRYFSLPSDRRVARSVAAVDEAVRGFIATARERMAADPALRERPSNLLEAMIVASDTQQGAGGDREIAGNVWTMLLAGEDTTANTLGWLLWLLQQNPSAMERCREEVRRLVPDIASITPETLASLDYVDACVSEAMRLKPVVPMMLNEAVRDTTVGDVRVKAGTMVWCVFRHATMQAQFFPDAKAFEPQRWLAGTTQGRDSAKRVAIPFGAGPRICPGRYLALLEIKMAMAVLLSQFDIESVSTVEGGEPDEYMAVTMGPIGLRMTLAERLEPALV